MVPSSPSPGRPPGGSDGRVVTDLFVEAGTLLEDYAY